MTHAPIKFTLGIAALALSAIAISACGNDVPSGAVAKVGDETITQEEFDKWFDSAAQSQATAAGGAVPDPPTYAKCVEGKKKAQPDIKGQKPPTDAELKKQCKTEYEALRTQVMQFLVQAEWVEQEAADQDVKVSDKEIEKVLEDEKARAFPNDKGDKKYKQFLESSGMTEEDILTRVRLQELQRKLTQKITEDAKKVSDEDIETYYEKNKKRFAQPETRDLQVILTKNEAKAEQAKKAVEDGDSFKSVVKKYSIDPATKKSGGKLPSVTEGQQEKAFDEEIFSTDKGEIAGPVKTQFGWYVFKVNDVSKASQQSLEDAKETIRNLLRSQGQQKSLDKFVKDFQKRYKEQTNCADDYRISECDNAPKEKTNTAAVPGGAQGGAPQQPQGGAPAPQVPQQ